MQPYCPLVVELRIGSTVKEVTRGRVTLANPEDMLKMIMDGIDEAARTSADECVVRILRPV